MQRLKHQNTESHKTIAGLKFREQELISKVIELDAQLEKLELLVKDKATIEEAFKTKKESKKALKEKFTEANSVLNELKKNFDGKLAD